MILLLAALQSLAGAPDPPPDPPRAVFHGRRGEVTARAPRVEDARIVIDGRLDEQVWGRAAILTGFSQLSPVDRRPAEDSTEVLVWYSPYAMHFGIRAFESHGIVNATLADRDKIEGDDRVEILVDTFNDRRLALSFGVNPLGVQADGFRNNSPTPRPDFTTDFVYDSKGRLTDYGYEVEVRVPFKSIRYQSGRVQDWGINFIRLVQHSGYENTWTPALLSAGPLVGQSGRLAGLTDLKRGLVVDLNPFALGKVNGAPTVPSDPAAGWSYDREPDVGLNARWGVTTNLALDATYNADFSQVEADAGQIPEDVRFAIQFPEKRPFFLDGIEKFNVPNRLIYTRRIADPVAALRLTGKLSGMDVGLISAVDDRSTSPTGDHPVYNWLRLRRDVGHQSTTGVTYTDKVDGGAWNRVAEGDVHLVWNRSNFVDVQHAWSFTHTGTTTTRAPLWETFFDCTGRFFGCRYGIRGIHGDFRAAGGFLPRTGYVEVSSLSRVTLIEGKRGALMEKLNIRWNTNWIWGYNEFDPTDIPRETRAAFLIPMTVRGGWSVTPGVGWETYRFDPAAYATYALERARPVGTDTVGLLLPPRINDVWALTFQANSPQFPRFALTARTQMGMDVNFFEPARTFYWQVTTTTDWRPTDKIRLNLQYNHARRNRETDGTRFATQHIPRFKIEYQVSRPVFLRFVGQYNIDQQDALRDPATGYPILVRNSSGTLVRSATRSANDLRVDWLFSFRPNPGTVVFLGYGSSLTETDAFEFRDLRRVRDGFFVKLSYLFRL
ncbi:MAG: carbohydrate binding family 9 domain-containing protein [Gemmatimonadetes bacterium]|nr:carbohydrate binding family 9 domain-containing protein [Gemmatimonadota bacterium]